MLKREDLFQISFYEKSPFFGSIGNRLNFRISKCDHPDLSPDDPNRTALEVVSWPGPYNFVSTPAEDKSRYYAAFSSAGLDEITDYLNDLYRSTSFSRNVF